MTEQLVRFSADGQLAVITLPFSLRHRGGRKQVLSEGGAPPSPGRPNDTVIKALGRAFRWRKLLETGIYASIEDLAQAEKINPSYVSRILRLTLLAPPIIDAVMAGRQAGEMTAFLQPLPIVWEDQVRLGLST